MRDIADARKYIPPTELHGIEAGTSTYDCRPAIQRVIDELGPFGGRLYVPRGFYRLSAEHGRCLHITCPIIIEGEGYFSCLIPDESVRESDHVIHCEPSPFIDCSQTEIRNLFIGDPTTGTRRGGYGIYLDTRTKGATLPLLMIRNLFVADSGWASIYHVNDQKNNPNGGLYGSTITHCQLRGGIVLNGSGDSNHILYNVIGGTAIGVQASMADGASQLDIIGNNITAVQGAIRINGGRHVNIERNNIEQIAPGNINFGCMVLVRNVHWPTLRGNNLGAFSGITSLVRLSAVDGGEIAGNTLLPSEPGQIGIRIDATCQDVTMQRNAYGEGLTKHVQDAGIGTRMV